MSDVPEEILRLARERAEARGRRDFARADELRAAIAGAGWVIRDRAEGFELSEASARSPAVERLSPGRRPSPPPVEVAVSVLLDVEGWPGDARRFVASLAAQPAPPGGVEIVALDRSGSDDPSWAEPWPGRIRVLLPDAEVGYGVARNAALWRAAGEVVAIVDTSLECTGDLLSALVGTLVDPGVAVAGPFGLASADLREYQERSEGEVVAIQGYCLAARRADALAAGGFRESFAFYRNADIDLSFRLRCLGPGLRRAVAVGAHHCRRHAHRAWEATPPDVRETQSRRNLRRVLDRFGDRADLAVP